MSDVHVPGLGNVPKPVMIAALAGGVGIIGYAWWRRSSGGGAAATDPTATDPTATDTSGTIDPSTGVPYAQEYGSYTGIGASGYYADQSTGAVIGSGYGPTQIAPATTNAAWAQQVEATLTALGYDPVTTAAAIGKYLTGQPVTSDQAAIVQAAIGQQGYPPEGALPIHTQTSTGQTPTPATVGAVTDLHATNVYAQTIDLDWTPVKGATGYTVWVDGKRYGTFAYSNAQLHGLKPNHNTRITVAAENNGKWGATGKTIYVHTKK